MHPKNNKIPITPDTKISQLLECYPQLEKTLIDITPTFKKLKNPVLRKTVARITSVRQAAKIGNVSLGEVVNRLRTAAGISEFFETNEDLNLKQTTTPTWFDATKIVQTMDARPMLERGEQPVNLVLSEVKKISVGDIYALITDFVPVPLIEKTESAGFDVWFSEEGTIVTTYFRRK